MSIPPFCEGNLCIVGYTFCFGVTTSIIGELEEAGVDGISSPEKYEEDVRLMEGIEGDEQCDCGEDDGESEMRRSDSLSIGHGKDGRVETVWETVLIQERLGRDKERKES